MKKKIASIILVLVLLVAVMRLLLLTSGGAPLFSDLTGYKSTYTLNGASIVGTEHKRVKDVYLQAWRFDYEQLYSNGMVVNQGKRTWRSDDLTCGSRVNRRDQHHLDSCLKGRIDRGGEYIVTVTSDQGETTGIDALAVIGETELYIGVPKDQLESFAEFKEWREFFNSMEPVNLKFRPYKLYVTHSGPG